MAKQQSVSIIARENGKYGHLSNSISMEQRLVPDGDLLEPPSSRE